MYTAAMTEYTHCYRRIVRSKFYFYRSHGSAPSPLSGPTPIQKATNNEAPPLTLNPTWELLTQKHAPTDTCKAITYIHKYLLNNSIITNHLNHPLSTPNSIVLNVTEDDMTTLRIINIYHPPLTTQHGLNYIFQHYINNLMPALLIRDFNTHAPLWSTLRHPPFQWAQPFTNWLDANSLHCLNEPGLPTWFSSREEDKLSILDLAFINEATIFGGQLSTLTISHSKALGSDHAVFLLNYHPTYSLAMLPPQHQKGIELTADATTLGPRLSTSNSSLLTDQSPSTPFLCHSN